MLGRPLWAVSVRESSTADARVVARGPSGGDGVDDDVVPIGQTSLVEVAAARDDPQLRVWGWSVDLVGRELVLRVLLDQRHLKRHQRRTAFDLNEVAGPQSVQFEEDGRAA